MVSALQALIKKHLWLKTFSTFRINSGSISITRKIFGSGKTILSDEKMNDIIKIVKSIENSSLLIIDVSEKIKNRAKEKRRISWHVIRHIRRQFFKKYVRLKSCIKS